MTFSSIYFIFTFLPVLLLIYKLTPTRFHNVLLLLGSLVFYAWGNVDYMFLLIVLIAINYGFGHYIQKGKGRVRLRRLWEAIIVNVALLAYFKYYGFLLKAFFFMFPHPPAYMLFSTPLGISFFTFSIIAYLVDVYYKRVDAETNVINFALFVSFFPKLIMGPIERYDTMRPQLLHHPQSGVLFEQGCGTFMIGLAQKLILANTMGSIWAMTQTTKVSMLAAWLGILAYTFQIYFDFQGYTQMAIGLGKMFGFRLSQNFHYPYIAISVTDFWHRWHMTLSSWFRDYVYIPMKGNRTTFNKVLRNLLVVWLLTGLWHGANWNFIFWGMYYGVIIIVEKFIVHDALQRQPTFVRWLLTFLLVMLGWVFFASSTLGDAFGYIGNMLLLRGNGVVDEKAVFILTNYGLYFVVAAIACTPLVKGVLARIHHALRRQMWYIKPIATACFFVILLSFLVSNTYQAFLYFTF